MALAISPPQSFDEVIDGVLYDDVGAILAKVSEQQWTEYKADLQRQSDAGGAGAGNAQSKLDKINDAEDFLDASPLSLTFSNPFTSNDEGVWGEGNLPADIATAGFGGDLLDLRLDVDQIIGYALGLKNGGTLSLEDVGIKSSVISAEVELLNFEIGPSFNLETELQLAPELMVDLRFSAPVLIKGEIGKQTQYSGTWENIPEIALVYPDAAEGVGAVSFDVPVEVTPTFSVEATLSNRTYIDVAVAGELSGLAATVGIDGFAEIDIGPVFKLPFETDSLAQIDIYNATFDTGGWSSPDEADRNIGSTRTRANGEPSVETNPLSETLYLDPKGEIVFQARSKTTSNDVAKNDDRVQQFLSTEKLIADDIKRRGYEDKAWEGLGISTDRLFDFKDNDVRFNIEQKFKIDVGQHAQVMTDGQFRISDGDTGFFYVERGGSLELGAANPYGGSTERSIFQASLGAYGLVNEQILRIDGDVYMGGDALAGNDADRYKFTNTGGAQLRVGADGRVKFDGKFENQKRNSGTGFVTNAGSFELTSDNNTSTGVFRNSFGGELDLFGGLTLYEGTDASINSFRELYNNGQVTLYSGATLNLRGGDQLARLDQRSDFVNNGEFIIRKGADFELSANNGGIVPGSYQSVDRAIFENLHVVDNRGVIRNAAGQEIVNGKAGTDWQAYRQLGDPLLRARQIRSEALANLPGDYAAAGASAREAAKQAADARFGFVSAAQQFVNDSKTFVETTSAPQVALWALTKTQTANANATQAQTYQTYLKFVSDTGGALPAINKLFYNNYLQSFDDYLNAIEVERATKTGLESQVGSFAGLAEALYGGPLRQMETGYGNALRTLSAAERHEATIRRTIESTIEAEARAGLGVLVNGRDGLILNQGELLNHAVLVNTMGADIYNDTGGHIDNAGGYLRSSGLLVNQVGAQLTNTGVIDNGMQNLRAAVGILGIAELVNLGDLSNQGEVVNHDTLVNYGLIDNGLAGGTGDDALLTNSAIMQNLGQLNNNAQLENLAGAELNNHGKIVNNGLLVNDGVFNNGLDPSSVAGFKGDTFSTGSVIDDAVAFFRNSQIARAMDNAIINLTGQRDDSVSREALVTLTQIPTGGNPLLAIIFGPINFILETAYNSSLAAAKAKTAIVQLSLDNARGAQTGARNSILARDSVKRERFENVKGDLVYGSAFIDLAAVTSFNTANLENNGTIINRGLLNNIAVITNNEPGLIRNSGVLMLGKTGKIINAGHLLIDYTQVDGLDPKGQAATYKQDGMLISNGRIDNSGLFEIASGTVVNGTLKDPVAVINNSGQLLLAGGVETVFDAAGVKSEVFSSAGLVNQATINNQAGGNLTVGSAAALVQNGRTIALNTLANFGDIVNESGATIENYGHLYNAGLLDNQAGSSFVNKGLLNNADTGEIRFAQSTAVEGQVINNGFISMADAELLTLTGSISGNGTFVGNTLLNQRVDSSARPEDLAVVNPGNSPGLLTFDGNLIAAGVNWVMEIWGTERGSRFGYDAVDVTGDFTLAGDMSLSILSLLDFATVSSQTFTFLSIAGDLFDAAGAIVENSFRFDSFAANLGSNWTGNWANNGSGWDLVLAFNGDEASNKVLLDALPTVSLARLQQDPSAVPVPGTLWIVLSGLMVMGYRPWSRRRRQPRNLLVDCHLEK